MPTIYVLLCDKDRYYIGKTNRLVNDRIEEHFNKNGSEWTKKYKPIRVIEQIRNADEFDEDKYTKKYMKKYGIDKVRGGSYTQIYLPEYSIMALEKELCTSSNLCYRCNRSGHFVNQCYATTKVDGTLINDKKINNDDTKEYFALEKHSSNLCFRCNRPGHFIDQCYATTKADGTLINDHNNHKKSKINNDNTGQCFIL